MKLLSKSEVNLETTTQRKSEIDSGVYLATRIDKLRQTLLDLEEQQKIFIDSNRKVINGELSDLFEKKRNLAEEIKSLIVDREELCKPLDEEWKKVKEEKNATDLLQSNLEKQIVTYDNKINEAESTRIYSIQEAQRAETANATAQKYLSEIHSRLQEIDARLTGAHTLEEKIQKECAEKTRILEIKERKLDYDKKHFKDFEKNLKSKEQELALREKRLSIMERKHE